jgi:hypothetical protein
MRLALTIVGIFLILAGGVWFLQGINIIPGSFMTGQTKWTIIGVLVILAGCAMIFGARRSRR